MSNNDANVIWSMLTSVMLMINLDEFVQNERSIVDLVGTSQISWVDALRGLAEVQNSVPANRALSTRTL